MFCPNCGQQQVADSTKFCPRCGTQLAGLAEWLTGGAPLVVRDAPAPPLAPAPMSPRRRGMRRGAKVMFLSGVLFPFFFVLSAAEGDPGPAVVPLIIFFIGLSITLYARLFGEDLPRVKGKKTQAQLPGTATNPLPPASADSYVSSFGRRGRRTAELPQPPPSVTDHTTRLLDDE